MKRLWLAFWRLGIAYLFYPIMILLMAYITFKGYHWIFGVMIILAIFILDPMWGRIARNATQKWRNRS